MRISNQLLHMIWEQVLLPQLMLKVITLINIAATTASSLTNIIADTFIDATSTVVVNGTIFLSNVETSSTVSNDTTTEEAANNTASEGATNTT